MGVFKSYSSLRNSKLPPALEILKKTGRMIGDTLEIGGQFFVRVDGALLTDDQVFGSVEDYNRSLA